MNMTMTLNPNGMSHAVASINPQPGMGLMALMASAISPTQMTVLPSIVATGPTVVSQTLSPHIQTSTQMSGGTPSVSTNDPGGQTTISNHHQHKISSINS